MSAPDFEPTPANPAAPTATAGPEPVQPERQSARARRFQRRHGWAGLLAVMVLAGAVYALQPPKTYHPALIRAMQCTPAHAKFWSDPELKGTSWVQGRLQVQVTDNNYCGGPTLTGAKYAISDQHIDLRWRWESSGYGTACYCDHHIQFELPNVPPGQYEVTLHRSK